MLSALHRQSRWSPTEMLAASVISVVTEYTAATDITSTPAGMGRPGAHHLVLLLRIYSPVKEASFTRHDE